MIDTSTSTESEDSTAEEADFLTLADIADALGVTWGRAYQLVVNEKRIASIRPGYQFLVARADFESFAAEQRPRGKPKGSKAGETASAAVIEHEEAE